MFLTACGDSDGASANNGSATLEDVYASEDDLPGCTEKYDGAVAFVQILVGKVIGNIIDALSLLKNDECLIIALIG